MNKSPGNRHTTSVSAVSIDLNVCHWTVGGARNPAYREETHTDKVENTQTLQRKPHTTLPENQC